MARRTPVIAIALAFAVLLAACSSSEPAAETTTTSVPSVESESTTTTPAGGDESTGDPDPATSPFDELTTMEHMCRTLALLQTAGATAPHAANAIALIDLSGATPTEIFNYGNLLTAAPRTTCPELTDYANDVLYWLGV
ncbi:MAG: hypothetical protein ACR2N2_08625 [Acidimicrobiia bacterium]